MKIQSQTVEEHIMNRDYFPILTVSLKKFLNASGMIQYHNLCLQRIKDAMLIDNVDIKYDLFERDDLLLTGKGLNKCYDIISGYIDKNMIDELAMKIDAHNKYAMNMNHLIMKLRHLPTNALKRMDNIIQSSDNDEYNKFISRYINVELESRTIKNRIRALCAIFS